MSDILSAIASSSPPPNNLTIKMHIITRRYCDWPSKKWSWNLLPWLRLWWTLWPLDRRRWKTSTKKCKEVKIVNSEMIGCDLLRLAYQGHRSGGRSQGRYTRRDGWCRFLVSNAGLILIICLLCFCLLLFLKVCRYLGWRYQWSHCCAFWRRDGTYCSPCGQAWVQSMRYLCSQATGMLAESRERNWHIPCA